MPEEAQLEDRAVEWAEARGWFVRKLAWGQNRRGAPDRLFIKNGRAVFIEFKKRHGSLQALQARERAEMLLAGADVHFCDRWSVFLAIMLPEM